MPENPYEPPREVNELRSPNRVIRADRVAILFLPGTGRADRIAYPSIWHMGSDRDPDAYILDHPPLTAHFRKVHDNKVAIFAFEEQ